MALSSVYWQQVIAASIITRVKTDEWVLTARAIGPSASRVCRFPGAHGGRNLPHQVTVLQDIKRFLLALPILGACHDKILACPAGDLYGGVG